MTADMQWPYSVLPPRKAMAEVAAGTMDGGYGNTAVDDIVEVGMEFWRIVLDEIPVASPAQKRAWRQIEAKLNGRLYNCEVPVYTTAQVAIAATLRDAANAASDQLVIAVTDGTTLIPGMQASMTGASGDVRLYRIASVQSQVATAWSVTIWPRLRENMAAAAALDFATPRCVCRLESDDAMANADDDYAGRTLAKATFEEARW